MRQSTEDRLRSRLCVLRNPLPKGFGISRLQGRSSSNAVPHTRRHERAIWGPMRCRPLERRHVVAELTNPPRKQSPSATGKKRFARPQPARRRDSDRVSRCHTQDRFVIPRQPLTGCPLAVVPTWSLRSVDTTIDVTPAAQPCSAVLRQQKQRSETQTARQREVAQREFEERLQEREAAHADELAQARAASFVAGARAEQFAADVASLHEQLSALNDRLEAETQGRLQAAAESEQARAELEGTRAELQDTRTQHAARIESLEGEWRRQGELVAEQAARQREVAQREFEERLQERDAAHADELTQAQAATLAAGARAEQSAADVVSLHEQLSALNDRLETETQGRLQAAAESEQARMRGAGRHSHATRGANREPAGRVAAAGRAGGRAGGRAARSRATRVRGAAARAGGGACRRVGAGTRRNARSRSPRGTTRGGCGLASRAAVSIE